MSRPAREVEQTSVHEDQAKPALAPGAPSLDRIASIVVLVRSDAYTLADEIRELLPKPAKPAGAR